METTCRGFIAIPILLVVGLLVLGGGTYIFLNNQAGTSEESDIAP